MSESSHPDVVRLGVVVPADTRTYTVSIGDRAVDLLPEILDEAAAGRRVVVCSDATVADLHYDRLAEVVRHAGREPLLWTFPAGEEHKTLATVADGYRWCAERQVERGELVIALGGGVAGDVGGYLAATYLRGLRLIQVPTTVVGQVDSAIGGKVGVDLPEGKNLVGAFHQPVAVVSDTRFLATLPDREWHAGLAEAIKSAVIGDAALYDFLDASARRVLQREQEALFRVVTGAARVKARIVGDDPVERDLRRVLNYGHTVGHAIERVAGYGVVLHGEAVAWGMAVAARIAADVGHCDDAFVRRQDDLLRRYGLLQPLPSLRREDLLAATRLDKKIAEGRISWILPRAPGEVVISTDVPTEAVERALAIVAT